MTSDDEARLRPEFEETGDTPHETQLTVQASERSFSRPEMAMAAMKIGRFSSS